MVVVLDAVLATSELLNGCKPKTSMAAVATTNARAGRTRQDEARRGLKITALTTSGLVGRLVWHSVQTNSRTW